MANINICTKNGLREFKYDIHSGNDELKVGINVEPRLGCRELEC